MLSDEIRSDTAIVLIGVPTSRRVRDFVAAAEQFGRRVKVISYVDAILGRFRCSEARRLVRIESPSECAATTREILKAGIAPLEAVGGAPLTSNDVDRLTGQRGEIPPLKQWYLGFRQILQDWETDWGADVRWMSAPRSIITCFDKLTCLQRWTRVGLPVPPRYPNVAGYDDLRKQVRSRHERLFIKPRYGYSAVGAVALEWRDHLVRAITSVEIVGPTDRPRLLLCRHPRVLKSEPEVARLIDVLGREEMLVEAWLPKVRWNGVPFDLRLVVIDGSVRHVVGRANSTPFTNLNLDARRVPRAAVDQRLGDSWTTVESLTVRAAAEIPDALVLGIDLLVSPDRQRFALLEANAFGDYLPGLSHQGLSTHEAVLNAVGTPAGGASMTTTVVAPSQDLLMITFDALRFDVADAAWREGRTPFLRSLLPQGWERRHTPGSFTFSAHAAFFAGFWPTPATDSAHARPFTLRFPGSRSVDADTTFLAGENIVEGLRLRGYQTICVGGVGFFNPVTPLGSIFPRYFEDSHWRPEFGVTELHSPREQVRQACDCIAECSPGRPLFLFMNISATHPPTRAYISGASEESVATQTAALEYVDRRLPPLFAALGKRRRDGTAYLMSDHGTLFGEDGVTGHRVGHPDVWTVPYAECRWGSQS